MFGEDLHSIKPNVFLASIGAFVDMLAREAAVRTASRSESLPFVTFGHNSTSVLVHIAWMSHVHFARLCALAPAASHRGHPAPRGRHF